MPKKNFPKGSSKRNYFVRMAVPKSGQSGRGRRGAN